MKLNLLLINMHILPRKIIPIYFLIFSQFYQTKFLQIHVGGQIHSRSQIRSLLSTFDTFICTKLHSKVSEISSASETTLLSLIYAPKRKCISLSHIDCCYQFSLGGEYLRVSIQRTFEFRSVLLIKRIYVY